MRLTYEPPTTGKLKNLEKTLCLAGRLLLLKIVKIWNIMEVGFNVGGNGGEDEMGNCRA